MRSQYDSERLVRLSCVKFRECGVLGCALRPSCGGPRVNLTYRWMSQHIPSCISTSTCCTLPTSAQDFLFWVMVLHLSVLLSYACRSGLNNQGGVSGVHAAGGTFTQNYAHTDKKYRDARARKCKYNDKKQKLDEKYKHTTNIQLTVPRLFSKEKSEIQIRPTIQTAGRRQGQLREGVFLRAGLFVQIQQCRNYETRRCWSVPNGAGWCRMLH